MVSKRRLRYDYSGYLLLIPNYLIYTTFILYPALRVIYLSFAHYRFVTPPTFAGLSNYLYLLESDRFRQALFNTMYYWIGTVLVSMALGLLIAVVLNRPKRGVSLFRSIYYLPNLLSLVVVGIAWLWIYNPQIGILNSFLRSVGWRTSDWLRDPELAMTLVIIPGIWTLTGFTMIIYLAGLQGIDQSYYEVADIEGAGSIRKLFSITLPLLRPISFFVFVMSSIRSFQVFELIYIMTGGGPRGTTTTLTFEVYQMGFMHYQMGRAAAASVVLMFIVLIVTVTNFWYGREGFNDAR